MSLLAVDEAGPATSVQDAGRFGALRYGLSSAGAMDRYALAAANVLVGQNAGAAAIEIGPFAARFAARAGAVRVALYGADRAATVGDRPVRLARSFVLQPGETLALRAARGGTFTYLAVEGGIAGTPSFGSMSVHARAGLGSPIARALAAGDALDVGTTRTERGEMQIAVVPFDGGPIRVVLGPQDDYFSPDEIAAFLAAEWRIAPASDRMGFRLDGPPISAARGNNIVSDGIANGQIQIPGGGQPLVLLADRGTTGGYPKIAGIVTADLGRFAQIQPGKPFRFQSVGIDAARRLTCDWRMALDGLAGRVVPLRGAEPSSEALLAANLAGGAVSALDTDTWSHS
ncbi:MAG: biotin-dependent carboxyltransferase family protein [Rhodospirillales bacterium]|nr:biotin-dependent carboxyltransferase family protein [Rhodospirillales bacterium]